MLAYHISISGGVCASSGSTHGAENFPESFELGFDLIFLIHQLEKGGLVVEGAIARDVAGRRA